jgi:predicted RNase H-like HicB family nuclease
MIVRYLEAALDKASYEELEDGTFSGRIALCPGVIAFAKTKRGCQIELRSVLQDWVVLGSQLNDPLPVIDGIDLSKKVVNESLASL